MNKDNSIINTVKEKLINNGEKRKLFDEQKESYRIAMSDYEKEKLVKLLKKQNRLMILFAAFICCIFVFSGIFFLFFYDDMRIFLITFIFPVILLLMVIYSCNRGIRLTKNPNAVFYRFAVTDKYSVRYGKKRSFYIETSVVPDLRLEVSYFCYKNINQNDYVLYYEINGSVNIIPWHLI